MKHKTISSVVNGGNELVQKYMYEGQERQDELWGLTSMTIKLETTPPL